MRKMENKYTYSDWKNKRRVILKSHHTAKYRYSIGKELSEAHYCSMCGKPFTRYDEVKNKHIVTKSFIWLNQAGFMHINLCLRVDDCWDYYTKKRR